MGVPDSKMKSQTLAQDDFAEGDLYDAVLTGGSSDQERRNDNTENSQNGDTQGGGRLSGGSKSRSNSVSSDDRISYTGSGLIGGKKAQLYVGNLTWVSF